MKNYEKVYNHPFIKILIKDCEIKDVEFKEAFKENSPPIPAKSEYEYYVYNSMFYFLQLLGLCRQLEGAVELLSNFSYRKTAGITRGDHLLYNVENYIIRIASLSDRLLQTINAICYLGIDERDINQDHVLRNIKVSSTSIPKLFKEFHKTIKDYTGERNNIVHKFSYKEKQLSRVELFYQPFAAEALMKNPAFKHYKTFRQNYLTSYLKVKKKEFKETNNNAFGKLLLIIDYLVNHYEKVKKILPK
jgi:hypothetical protein